MQGGHELPDVLLAAARDGPPFMAIADGEKLRFAESRNERPGIELAAGGEGQGPERCGLREDDVVDELPAVPLALR